MNDFRRANIKTIEGVIPPIITTFDEQGRFDHKRMEDLVAFLKSKVNGLFVCGTYGSGPLMSSKERKEVLETVVKSVNNSIPITVNVSSSNPEEIFDLSTHAESLGVDAVSSLPPYYYATSYNDDDLERFFVKLINTVNIPVFLYNNPKTTGISVSIQLLEKLSHEGLAGIKDSSSDLFYFYKCRYHLNLNKFRYIVGTESFIIPTIPLGAVGTISGLAISFPELIAKLYNATKSKKYEKAFELQEKVNYLREIHHMAQSIPAIHMLMKLRGIDVGYPRYPYSEVPEQIQEKMKKFLAKIDFLS